MTNSEAKRYLAEMAKGDKLELSNVDEQAGRAVELGIADFWGAHDWRFRQKDHTLTISSSAEEYELPADFDLMVTMREKDSANGLSLRRYLKEDFDALAPKLSAHAAGNPIFYALFWDDKKRMITFWPQPSGATTYYIAYLKTPPADLTGIPDKYHGGLMAFMARHMYPFGHIGRINAEKLAVNELIRLRTIDKESGARITHMPDETEEFFSATGEAPWLPSQ